MNHCINVRLISAKLSKPKTVRLGAGPSRDSGSESDDDAGSDQEEYEEEVVSSHMPILLSS